MIPGDAGAGVFNTAPVKVYGNAGYVPLKGM